MGLTEECKGDACDNTDHHWCDNIGRLPRICLAAPAKAQEQKYEPGDEEEHAEPVESLELFHAASALVEHVEVWWMVAKK